MRRIAGSALYRIRDTKLDGRVWLIRGDAGIANPILAAAIFLKFEAY
jgi:hypothetical protein